MSSARSHRYCFRFPLLLAHVGGPVAAALGFFLIVEILEGVNALPRARPEGNADQVTLYHQFQLSRARYPAKIVLTGDSSCMMGVDAIQLGRCLGDNDSVVNLGLVIDMDMDIYAEAAKSFIKNNPNQVTTVVLLVTPQRLESASWNSYFREMWNGFKQINEPQIEFWKIHNFSAFRSAIKNRALAQPLHGTGAEFYGFVEGIREYLQLHRGSGVDCGQLVLRNRFGQGSFQLNDLYFDAIDDNPWSLPSGIRFMVGIMPIPETLVTEGYEQVHREMLSTVAAYFQADAELFDLPPTLPNGFFASATHLNVMGQARFTRKLAEVLSGFIELKPNHGKMPDASPADPDGKVTHTPN